MKFNTNLVDRTVYLKHQNLELSSWICNVVSIDPLNELYGVDVFTKLDVKLNISDAQFYTCYLNLKGDEIPLTVHDYQTDEVYMMTGSEDGKLCYFDGECFISCNTTNELITVEDAHRFFDVIEPWDQWVINRLMEASKEDEINEIAFTNGEAVCTSDEGDSYKFTVKEVLNLL